MNRWVFFLFRRYIGVAKTRGLKLTYVVAVLGVTIGVATLTLTQSVLNGFEKVFHESILGFNAHLVVLKEGGMENDQKTQSDILQSIEGDVQHATPFLYREGLWVANGKVKGAVLKGIEPSSFTGVYDVKLHPLLDSQGPVEIKHMLQDTSEVPPVILGADLAKELGVQRLGERLKLFLPRNKDSKVDGQNSFQVFRAMGTFSTGLYEFDHAFAFVDLNKLQAIEGDTKNTVTGLELKLKDPFKAQDMAVRLGTHLGPLYDIVSWQRLNGPLFQALRLERFVFFIIMALMIFVAAFNIVGVLLLMIFEKSREISILRAMGASISRLKSLFALQGMLVGLTGSLLGILLGALLAWILKVTHIFKLAKEVYLVEEVPVHFSVFLIISVVTVGLLIAYLATQIAIRRIRQVPLDL